jgi:hypothetical protein
MRKLKLDLEDLSVQSFATDTARGQRGTAHAHADTAFGGDIAFGDTALMPDPGDGTSVQPGDTQGDQCFTCELSCGTRGC